MKRLLVLLLLAAPAARADVFDALAVGAAASDVVTTEAALNRGYVETRLQNRGARIGANALLTSGTLLAAHELKKSGHRGWSKAVKIGLALGWGTCAALNVRTMQH